MKVENYSTGVEWGSGEFLERLVRVARSTTARVPQDRSSTSSSPRPAPQMAPAPKEGRRLRRVPSIALIGLALCARRVAPSAIALGQDREVSGDADEGRAASEAPLALLDEMERRLEVCGCPTSAPTDASVNYTAGDYGTLADYVTSTAPSGTSIKITNDISWEDRVTIR